MTLQSDLLLRCTDTLDEYTYVLFEKDRVMVSRSSADLYKYGVVTKVNGHMFLELYNSHTEALNRVDFDDPGVFILHVTQN